MANNKEKKGRYAEDVFSTLSVPGWSQDAYYLPQGAQSAVCAVVHEDGTHGVFRCLPEDPEVVAIERFRREIPMIRSISHPNIVKLLEWSDQPPYWYITRKGQLLYDYWEDGPQQAGTAFDIIHQLALGLQACHEKGIVHRDIKPKNIIVCEDRGQMEQVVPVLIDFGIALDPELERLTGEGDAVGNARYGADVLRRRQEDCPPWLDVFSLVQVFQEMLADRDAKNWQRPTHWRYVTYRSHHDPWFIQGVRALGAICSIEQTCPADGGGLCRLMDTLFALRPPNGEPSPVVQSESVLQAIAEGERRQVVRAVEDLEAIEASWQLARLQLTKIKAIFGEFEKEGSIKMTLDRNFEEEPFIVTGEERCSTVHCHANGKAFFEIGMTIHAFVPSRWPNGGKPEALKSMNVFACTLERAAGTGPVGRVFPYKGVHICIRPDASFWDMDPTWSIRGACLSEEGIRKILAQLFSEPEAWQLIAEL